MNRGPLAVKPHGPLLALVLALLSSVALGDEPNAGQMDSECPLDGTKFQTRAVLFGKQTGLRLDLKPMVEGGAMESALPRCPKCSYVGPERLRDEDLAPFRKAVASNDFKSDPLVARSNHAARALLLALTQPEDSSALAFEWLHASWELEAEPALWKVATERALAAFVKTAQAPVSDRVTRFEEPTGVEVQRTAQLMRVELLRRLSRFDEAIAALNSVSELPEFKRGAYPTLLDAERALLAKKNAAPQPFPKVPELDPHEDDLGWVTARATPGFKAFDAAFTIDRANLWGDIVSISLDARGNRLVDSARWEMPLKKGVATQTWVEFLALHAQAEALVKKNRWLEDWKRDSSERHVELWLERRTFEYLDLPAWKASGFKGVPAAKIILRQGIDAVVTMYLASEGGALVTSAGGKDDMLASLRGKPAPERKTGEHWLTATPVFYHPRGAPPEFMRVSVDGKYELRRTRVFSMQELDELQLEHEKFMKEGGR